MKGQASTFIAATPEDVFDAVADITRMGEWSPETTKAEWVPPATGPAVGAKFKGTNKWKGMTWSTKPEVVVADRGKEFTFKTPSTVWSYTFAPEADGTRVTEGFEITSGLTSLVTKLFGRESTMTRGVEQTLARIKAAVEQQ